MSNFADDLNKCETIKQVFDVVNKHYDTGRQMGVGTKITIKASMGKLIKITKLTKK